MIPDQISDFTNFRNFLEKKVELYNVSGFIESDPIRIPHLFRLKEDIEISGFLTATLSWGQRKTILNNSLRLIKLMDDAPFDFISNTSDQEYQRFSTFVHRTFGYDDCRFFLQSLKSVYRNQGGIENVFTAGYSKNASLKEAIMHFRDVFLSTTHQNRSRKHISDPGQGSAAKRLNMFLRWMVRDDSTGVDFGIWKSIPPSALMCPLDLHSGRIARKLGLLSRRQDDWKAVEELTANLRLFDPADPVRYDFALFGMGVSGKSGGPFI